MRRMYFLGVTTGQSSIHRLFPKWASLAGLGETELTGLDIAVNAPETAFREALRRMADDPYSQGALVTTHKTSVYAHARDMFEEFDGDADFLGEVSCIVQRGRRFEGIAIDTLTAGLSLQAIVGDKPFPGSVLIMGAGGAGLALAVVLSRRHTVARVILTDVSAGRLVEIADRVPAEFVLVNGPEDHDRLAAALPPGSLIVNATGMGKDRPGCPVTEQASFPAGSIAWDFNYRGDLRFLECARARGATAVDGWSYFLHGWSEIMARVFGFELTPELFAAMQDAAPEVRTDSEARVEITGSSE